MSRGGFICPHCRKYTAAEDTHCIHCGRYVGSPTFAAIARAVGGTDHLATKLLLGGCLVMFGVSLAVSAKVSPLEAGPTTDVLVLLGANTTRVDQWWRLVSAAFLHGGFWHMALNGLAFVQIGRGVEDTWGFSRTVLAFFLTAIAGNALSLWMHGAGFVAIGASTGLYGFLGIELGELLARRRAGTWKLIRQTLIYAALMALFLPLDFWGHAGGLIAGIVLGFAYTREWRPYLRDRIAAVLAVMLLVSAPASIVASVVTTPLQMNVCPAWLAIDRCNEGDFTYVVSTDGEFVRDPWAAFTTEVEGVRTVSGAEIVIASYCPRRHYVLARGPRVGEAPACPAFAPMCETPPSLRREGDEIFVAITDVGLSDEVLQYVITDRATAAVTYRYTSSDIPPVSAEPVDVSALPYRFVRKGSCHDAEVSVYAVDAARAEESARKRTPRVSPFFIY